MALSMTPPSLNHLIGLYSPSSEHAGSFHLAVSISSFDHDGLGRYSDQGYYVRVGRRFDRSNERAPHIPREDIQLRAYFISERRQTMGWPGNSSTDWIEAESQLVSEAKRRLKKTL
jgi:hypothetical protein